MSLFNLSLLLNALQCILKPINFKIKRILSNKFVHAYIINKIDRFLVLKINLNATIFIIAWAWWITGSYIRYIINLYYISLCCVEEVVSDRFPLKLLLSGISERLWWVQAIIWIFSSTEFSDVIIYVAASKVVCIIAKVSCILQTSCIVHSDTKRSIAARTYLTIVWIAVWYSTLWAFYWIIWPTISSFLTR